MINWSKIKAIAFDYGGTLDNPGLNWMEVYLQIYALAGYPLAREVYREAYIYAERKLEQEAIINRNDAFWQTQLLKMKIQLTYLAEQHVLKLSSERIGQLAASLARVIDGVAAMQIERNVPVLKELSQRYPLLLVSNFYGNLQAVVTEYGIASYFRSLTDSTLEGIRKPNPELWQLSFHRVGFLPGEVLVVGDSMKNDILPAQSLGCQTLHLCREVSEENAIKAIEELIGLVK